MAVRVATCWVLGRLYGATGAEVRETGRDLLATRQLAVEHRAVVARASARLGDAEGDLADALIAECAAAAGCERTVTLHRQAVRVGMALLH